MIAKKVFIV